MKNKAKPTKKQRTEFIWMGLRIGFWMMIGLWVVMMYLPENLISDSVAFLWFADSIFVFVVSIIHLSKYRQKAFAITSLVISSILIILLVLAVIMIFMVPGFGGYGEEVVLYDNVNVTLSGDLIRAASFVMYSPGELTMGLESDNFVDIYLMEEDEYERYRNNETFYYIQKSIDVQWSNWEDIYLEEGEYRVVISPVEGPINYSFELSVIPYY